MVITLGFAMVIIFCVKKPKRSQKVSKNGQKIDSFSLSFPKDSLSFPKVITFVYKNLGEVKKFRKTVKKSIVSTFRSSSLYV